MYTCDYHIMVIRYKPTQCHLYPFIMLVVPLLLYGILDIYKMIHRQWDIYISPLVRDLQSLITILMVLDTHITKFNKMTSPPQGKTGITDIFTKMSFLHIQNSYLLLSAHYFNSLCNFTIVCNIEKNVIRPLWNLSTVSRQDWYKCTLSNSGQDWYNCI